MEETTGQTISRLLLELDDLYSESAGISARIKAKMIEIANLERSDAKQQPQELINT